MSGTDLQLEDRHHQAIAISNHLSQTHRTYFGRGAGSVKTTLHRAHVLTVLEDIYSPLERTLINSGDSQIVLDARLAFQSAMRDDYVSVVERVTGRKVRAFLSQNHIAPDIASELFVLEPVLPEAGSNDGAGTHTSPSPTPVEPLIGTVRRFWLEPAHLREHVCTTPNPFIQAGSVL